MKRHVGSWQRGPISRTDFDSREQCNPASPGFVLSPCSKNVEGSLICAHGASSFCCAYLPSTADRLRFKRALQRGLPRLGACQVSPMSRKYSTEAAASVHMNPVPLAHVEVLVRSCVIVQYVPTALSSAGLWNGQKAVDSMFGYCGLMQRMVCYMKQQSQSLQQIQSRACSLNLLYLTDRQTALAFVHQSYPQLLHRQ